MEDIKAVATAGLRAAGERDGGGDDVSLGEEKRRERRKEKSE